MSPQLFVEEDNGRTSALLPWARSFRSASLTKTAPFDELLLSWNATSADEALRFSVAVGGDAPKRVALWSAGQRRGHAPDADVLRLPRTASDFRVLVEGPKHKLRRLSVALRHRGEALRHSQSLTAIDCPVPELSQRSVPDPLGRRLCSPSSVAMVLRYWLREGPDPEAMARLVHDEACDIYGNWSFNVAAAGQLGLHAIALWLQGEDDLHALIGRGIPVVISHRFEAGALPESPLPRTSGHLIVLRGLSVSGDWIVNDPAADPRKGEAVRRIYPRRALLASWTGLAYLLAPESS